MTSSKNRYAELLPLSLCAVLAALLNLMFFGVHYKQLTVLLCIVTVSLLIFRRKNLVFPLPAALLAIYVLLCAVSGTGAVSGKFFLKEYVKLLMAFSVFCVIILSKDRKLAIVRTAYILSMMAAVFAFISVELGSTAYLRPMFDALTGLTSTNTGFEEGIRLIGVFGNANVLASVMALGMLLSIHLMTTDNSYVLPCSVCLTLCTFCFVLAFSMGATVFFALACLVYFALSGKKRGKLLLIMLMHFISSALFAFGAFPFFAKPASPAPTELMLLCAALNLCVVRLLHSRLLPFFEKGRNALLILVAAISAAAVYIGLALTITGSYHYDSEGFLRRSLYLDPGSHTVSVTADGTVGVNIFSQNKGEIMTADRTRIAYRWAPDTRTIHFTVPEDSQVQSFVLWADEGVTINSVTIDGTKQLKLEYKLLPEFIANRLQGVLKSQNAVQRTIFFADGLKLFAQSPVWGSGLGSFESAACSVQSYYYETRYVHNHFIQILADGGILSLLAYVGFLISLAVCLARRRGENSAALTACLIMIVGHSVMEVTMSMSVYLPFAFGVFAMIAADIEYKPRPLVSSIVRWTMAGLYGLFAVLIALNMAASRMVDNAYDSSDSFMNALAKAASIDVFERNDYKLSYVYNSLFSASADDKERAEQFADQLSTVRSNSISKVLLRYYLEKQEYDRAFDCAEFALLNNRSDSDTWNDCFGLLSYYLTPSVLTEAQILEIGELYSLYEAANAELMTPVVLSHDSWKYLIDVYNLSNPQS